MNRGDARHIADSHRHPVDDGLCSRVLRVCLSRKADMEPWSLVATRRRMGSRRVEKPSYLDLFPCGGIRGTWARVALRRCPFHETVLLEEWPGPRRSLSSFDHCDMEEMDSKPIDRAVGLDRSRLNGTYPTRCTQAHTCRNRNPLSSSRGQRPSSKLTRAILGSPNLRAHTTVRV